MISSWQNVNLKFKIKLTFKIILFIKGEYIGKKLQKPKSAKEKLILN